MPQEAGKCENCCWCLSHCCIIYGVLGIILLSWFGWLASTRSITFQIEQAKHTDWTPDDKANACYGGAVGYAITLVISVCCCCFLHRRLRQYFCQTKFKKKKKKKNQIISRKTIASRRSNRI